MVVTFKSFSKAHGKGNTVEFTSPVVIGEYNGYKTYEFTEPSMGEKNLIEVQEDKINIMAGANTLNMELGQKIQNEYIIPQQGSIWLEAQLHEVKINNDNVEISYTLFNNGEEISDFDLSLTINEN